MEAVIAILIVIAVAAVVVLLIRRRRKRVEGSRIIPGSIHIGGSGSRDTDSNAH